MLSLENKEWEEFFIGGKNGLFNITSTLSGIDKNKLVFSDNGQIPYITRTDIDNGINLFVPNNQLSKYKINYGNIITIGLDTQTVFYQAHSFFTGQNIQVVEHNLLNKYNGLFLIPLIKIQMEKFNWGGNGATLGRLSRTKIMLPVNKKNKPNFEYMEEYTKSIKDKKLEEYKKYANKVLANLEYKKVELLENKEWEEFFLTDIFSTIQRGKRLTKSNQKSGNIPYISSTSMNNGVDNFIGNKTNVRIFSDCLTIANSGSVGASFYQPYKFVASDHVTHLKKENMSKYVYMFISTLTNRFSEKYNFNREINDARISREKIMLPVNKKNQPDFEYMDQYMKNITYKKINQYLNYLEKKN